MRNSIRRVTATVALSLTVAACVAQGETHASGGQSTEGGEDASGPSGTGGEGGAMTCVRSSRPRSLRRVRVTDSRLLEANTVALAASQDPQTLWLPDASDNVGSMVIVKEARAAEHRVTVLVFGKDADGNDTETEYVDSSPGTSRTFVVVTGEDCRHDWALLDPTE